MESVVDVVDRVTFLKAVPECCYRKLRMSNRLYCYLMINIVIILVYSIRLYSFLNLILFAFNSSA